MQEIWKGIYGFEGLYEVSTLGRVRSIGHIVIGANNKSSYFERMTKGRVLKTSLNRGGYVAVHLSKDSVKCIFSAHKLVTVAFFGLRPEGYQVNHKDGDKTNNRIDNLEYVTAKENTAHAICNNLRMKRTHSKLNEEKAEQIRVLLSGNNGKKQNDPCYISRQKIADMFGVSNGLIGHIAKNRYWRTA